MESHPRFSVLIPAYNAADTLGAQLDALRAQQFDGSWEILVADNRSTDGTVDLVRRYQAQLPNLRLIEADARPGKPYAVNLIAHAARGDYFLFLDADDVAAPDWLSTMAAAIEGRHAVAGRVDAVRLNQGAVKRPFGYRGVESKALNFLPYLIGCNMAISRVAYMSVGGYSDAIPASHDLDLSWKLQLKGYALHYAPEALVYYRHRPGLQALWKQIVGYAFDYPLLYKLYARHGMPRSSPRQVFAKYGWLIAHAYYLVRGEPERKAKWLYEAAYAWGLVRGSVHHRVVYL
jgi:glycosyltransferase involved in cell wall biosynthesis